MLALQKYFKDDQLIPRAIAPALVPPPLSPFPTPTPPLTPIPVPTPPRTPIPTPTPPLTPIPVPTPPRTPIPTPTPTPTPNPNHLDCTGLCKNRCSLHSRQNVCTRACGTCCFRCKCVPPGTFGNREMCGKCYTDMTTHHNKTKCP